PPRGRGHSAPRPRSRPAPDAGRWPLQFPCLHRSPEFRVSCAGIHPSPALTSCLQQRRDILWLVGRKLGRGYHFRSRTWRHGAVEYAHLLVAIGERSRDDEAFSNAKPGHRRLEVPRAKQQTKARLPPGIERLEPDQRGTGLRHPFDRNVGGDTAAFLEKGRAGPHGHSGPKAVLLAAHDLVDQDHRMRVRQQLLDCIGARLHARASRDSTRATLLPPNAKELLSIAARAKGSDRRASGSTSASGGIA